MRLHAAKQGGSMDIRVSANHRFLMTGDGRPFFWQGDTAWTLLQRLDRDETIHYLDDRAAKGFNVLQVMGITEFDALRVPNRYGDLPLHDMNPDTPNERYWQHVDWVIAEAAKRGMVLALLPCWGDKVNLAWGVGPVVFTPDNARRYGAWLGRRYRDVPLIWVVGGDRNPQNETHYTIWRATSDGLRAGDGGRHMMTFHPQGGSSSSEFFHQDAWLDLNMRQTGHHERTYVRSYEWLSHDYNLDPPKPCLDGEPCYEDHPIMIGEGSDYRASAQRFTDHDTRRAAYYALFAGACGHTYGANGVFQYFRYDMEDPDHHARWGLNPDVNTLHPNQFHSRYSWQESLHFPGAAQMQHAKHLLLSRPYFERIPDPGLVREAERVGREVVCATRSQHGSYAMVYVPTTKSVDLDLSVLATNLRVWWFDPRTGQAHEAGTCPNTARRFTPPAGGPDWVLVLDDAAQPYEAPGQRKA
jgi:hypothetical protein